MSRVTVYFLFWIQLPILVISSVMTGLNAALGNIENSIVWGLITIGLALCVFLVFRETINKILPPKPKGHKLPLNPDECDPSK